MGHSFTILTVCTGNIHRSALAGVLLSNWRDWYLQRVDAETIIVESAGTRAPVGVPMQGRTLAIAHALGAEDVGHRSIQLTVELVESADLILTATREHRELVLREVPSALHRTFTIREAARIATSLPPAAAREGTEARRSFVAHLASNRTPPPHDGLDDIVDPNGLDDAVFLEMTEQEVPALAELATVLFGMSRAERDAYAEAAGDPALLDGR